MGLKSHGTALSVASDPREMLIEAIERHGGRLNWVSHDLGVDRRRLYDKVEAWGLWPTVNRARERRRAERLERRAQCPTT